MQVFEVTLGREEMDLLGPENPKNVEEILAMLVSVDLGIIAGRALLEPAPNNAQQASDNE